MTTPTNPTWHDGLAALKAFVATSGAMPRLKSLDAEERRTAGWAKRQRVKFLADKLPAEHRKLLGKLNPVLVAPTTSTRTRTSPTSIKRGVVNEMTWVENASKVLEFIDANGKLPGRRSEIRDVAALGTWIGEQRRSHGLGRLDDDSVRILNEIHPNILASKEVRHPGFAKRLGELERFIAKHDRIPQASTPDEAELAVWMTYHQRESVGQRSDRIAAIRTRYGLGQQQIFRSWEESFRLTEEHLHEHGRLPKQSADERLGNWLSKCQQAFVAGDLTGDQIARLGTIGVSFETNRLVQNSEDRFAARLDSVCKFLAERGRLPIESDAAHLPAASWVRSQRKLFRLGELPQERVDTIMQRLPEILNGDGVRPDWDHWIDVAIRFHQDHGKLPGWSDSPEGLPSHWVSWQRRQFRNGKLSESRIETIRERLPALLDSIRRTSVPGGDKWAGNFAAVSAFHAKHGRLPRRDEPVGGLARSWIREQRKDHNAGKMQPARVAMIRSAMPELLDRNRASSWEGNLSAVAKFHATHGRIPYGGEWVKGLCPYWAKAQRRAHKLGELSPERVASANAKVPELLAGVIPRA